MSEKMEDTIRVLIAKPGMNGHNRGANLIASGLSQAGMEVIYTGPYQTPEMIVRTAIEEDVNVIGISSLDGAHNPHCTAIVNLLTQRGADDIAVVLGGIIPEDDKPYLESIGITGNYGPGTPLNVIVEHIRGRAKEVKGKR